MKENSKYSSLPDSISSLTDDEAITEIDLGDFLIENSKSDTLFEGFRDDIERTEKSLESDLQSLYDDIMGSGPETIVPKPLSMLTESEAEPPKVVLSDPEPLPEDENSSLEDIWMNPDDYIESDIPVVSLDNGAESVGTGAGETEPAEEAEIGTEDVRAGIFSMIDMLKKESDTETGFSDILSEIESNPGIATVDTELSSAIQLVSSHHETQTVADESDEEAFFSEDSADWDDIDLDEDFAQEETAETPVTVQENEEILLFDDNFEDMTLFDEQPEVIPPVSEAEEIPEIEIISLEEETPAVEEIPVVEVLPEIEEIPVAEKLPEIEEIPFVEVLPEAEKVPSDIIDTDSDDFEKELAALLGDDKPAEEEIPVPAQKKDFVINVPDDGNDYERAAAQPERFYQSAPMSTATLMDDPDLAENGKKDKKKKKDKKSQEPANKKKGAGDIVRNIILTISIITIIVCGGMLANVYVIEPYRFKADADKIASEMNENINVHSDVTVNDAQNAMSETSYPDGMLAKYSSLYDANNDLKGWISIPGFGINLPVAQGKDNDYYLKKDIYGKYTRYGVPFFDYRMSDFHNLHKNNVIYGHNMRHDDLIFGMLENYRDIEGFRQAPVIECNTIYGDHTWFVYAVFITNAEKEDDNGYVFPYNFIDLDKGNFIKYLEEVDARKLYTTGVDINLDDQLLTLSTCAYDFTDARLVVVARLRREGESVAIDTSKAYKNKDPKFPQAYYEAYGKTNTHANDPRW